MNLKERERAEMSVLGGNLALMNVSECAEVQMNVSERKWTQIIVNWKGCWGMRLGAVDRYPAMRSKENGEAGQHG